MNEIPLSLYIAMNAGALILIVFSLINRENIIRIITSFLAMTLSYVNSFLILNNNVVMIQSDGDTYSFIPITNTPLNYLWLFIALIMAIFLALFIMDEINMQINTGLVNEEEGEI